MATRRPPTIAEEIRQSRPFSSGGQEAALTLIRTASIMDRFFTTVLDGSGITGPQYNVLRILRGAGEAGLPTLAIRDRMVDVAPGVTRLLDRLETLGFVSRTRETGDRRQVTCRITSQGLALLATLDAPVQAAERAVTAPLSAAEQRSLVRLLDRVRAGLMPSGPDIA